MCMASSSEPPRKTMSCDDCMAICKSVYAVSPKPGGIGLDLSCWDCVMEAATVVGVAAADVGSVDGVMVGKADVVESAIGIGTRVVTARGSMVLFR
ncbi:hypothetical protein MRX96_041744 [Rhipicephalus microplus]